MSKKEKKEEVKPSSKSARIELVKQQLEKDYGKGALLGAKDRPSACEAISTGSLGLDMALGIGGLPKGRIIEIFGPEASGKTTLCLEIMAQAHKADSQSHCAIIDAEHSIDLGYAEKLGVDLNRLEIAQPDYGEQALNIAEKIITCGEFDVVVIDSVAALVPLAELEGQMGDARMAPQARLMSQALRKLTGKVSKSNSILIFTNQMRDKIGVMFGSPETTTGGNALKYYTSVRLDIRRSITKENSVMDGERRIGNQIKVKVVKNKVAPPFREAIFDILYGEGIDDIGEILDMAIDSEIMEKSGSFFSYKDIKIQGRENICLLLKDNPEIAEEIKEKIVESFKPVQFKATQKEVVDAN
jgi:recombination protein RecA